MDSARNTHASCLNTVSHTRRREITRGRSRRSARASVFMFSLNNGIKPSFKALSFSLFYYFFFLAQSVISRYIRFTHARFPFGRGGDSTRRTTHPHTHAHTQPRIISHPRCRHYGKIVRFLSIGRNRFAVFDRQPSITVTVRPLPFRENNDLPSPFPPVSAVIDNSR